MPTYEYKCPKCGNEFEVVRKITARPGAKCPKCGGKAERQLSGGAGLVFKGSGFYLTDYGRAGQKKSDSDSHVEKPKTDTPAKSEAPAAKPSKKKDQG